MAISDWFEINGTPYNVRVLEITEEANVLYTENTGRTMAIGAPVTLDPLGTFIGHKVEVAPKKGYESDFDRLYNFVIQPRSYGVPIKAVHGNLNGEGEFEQQTINYDAYISSASRKVKRIEENSTVTDVFGETIKVKWDKMSINCIPIKAQIEP